jgi:hypothetical protein
MYNESLPTTSKFGSPLAYSSSPANISVTGGCLSLYMR